MGPKLRVNFSTDHIAKEVKLRFSQPTEFVGFDGETAIKAGEELIRRGRELLGRIIVPVGLNVPTFPEKKQ